MEYVIHVLNLFQEDMEIFVNLNVKIVLSKVAIEKLDIVSVVIIIFIEKVIYVINVLIIVNHVVMESVIIVKKDLKEKNVI